MNAQEIYDTVVKHLFAQGKPAYGDYDENDTFSGSGCAYRTGELKCSIGCLIPDEAYRNDMEQRSLADILADNRYTLPVYLSDNLLLLNKLQNAHDNRLNWEKGYALKGWNYAELGSALLESALMFGLQTNILTRELIKYLHTQQQEA